MIVSGAVALALLLAPATKMASDQRLECGPTSGVAYYLEGGIISAADAGWQHDGIAGGRTTVARDVNGAWDVMFTDATGGIYSARAEGGRVSVHDQSDTDMAVTVVYPRVVEVYQFSELADGSVALMFLQAKGHDVVRKSALMVAACTAFKSEQPER